MPCGVFLCSVPSAVPDAGADARVFPEYLAATGGVLLVIKPEAAFGSGCVRAGKTLCGIAL